MFTDIIWQILVVLATAAIVGEIFRQFGLPSVAGELLSGLILGPTVLGVVTFNPQIGAISTISLFFIIFLIGLELNTEILRKDIGKATFLTITSFLVPLAASSIIAVSLFRYGLVSDFILALAISVPSISVISVMVMQYKLLGTPVGQLVLASVTITDIAAFIFLAAVSQSATSTAYLLFYLAIFIAAFILLDTILSKKTKSFQRLLRMGSKYVKSEDISYVILIAAGLLVAIIFQEIGISYILGAFFAGLIIHEELIGRAAFERILTTLGRLNRGFFIPVFFGFAGVEATRFLDPNAIFQLIVLVATSVGLSLILTYFGAKRLYRSSVDGVDALKHVSRQVSVILSGKGAVGIIIVSLALSYGLINSEAYALVIIATTVVSVLTPMLLRRR